MRKRPSLLARSTRRWQFKNLAVDPLMLGINSVVAFAKKAFTEHVKFIRYNCLAQLFH